jgi:hypothetical protein
MSESWEGIGAREIAVLETLPEDLQQYLALEAEDPEFVNNFLVPALRSGDAHGIILETIAREYTAHAMGAIDDTSEFYEWDTGMGKSFFKKVFKKITQIPKKIQKIIKKVLPKSVLKLVKKVGPWVSVGMPAKTFRKIGPILISIAGAVLAPFTGGASLVAATLIVKARQMYLAKNAADAAKRAARADYAEQKKAADAAEAETLAMVDKFFADNPAWFLQHDITPEKWATLTLDQKIDIISGGAKGTLPVGIGPVEAPPPGASTEPTMAQVDAYYNANLSLFVPYGVTPDKWAGFTLAQKLEIIRTGVAAPTTPGTPTTPTTPAVTTTAPSYAPSTYVPPAYAQPGYSQPTSQPSFAPSQPDYTQAPSADTQQAQASAAAEVIAAKGTFDLYVEGQKTDTFSTLEIASKSALMRTKLGDRFEIIANGVSTGLRVRTSSGSIDVPADIEDKVRGMDRAKMGEFVAQAENATSTGSAIPWYLLPLAAAAGAVALLK